jgi:hypothetical protein
MHYNFCRRQTPGTTPAVAAGVTDHIWKVDDIVALVDEAERTVNRKRGPFEKRAA